MEQRIDPRKVMLVMTEVNTMLKQKEVANIEALLGLQELVGRIVVTMCTSPVQATDVINLAKQHLDDTVRIGFEVKNTSLQSV